MVKRRRVGFDVLTAFLSNVAADDRAACWPWQGGVSAKGYGLFSVYIDGRWVQKKAHRIVYEMKHGPIARGAVIRHRCHNRICCNPDHLIVGTISDNNRDMVEAGRQAAGEAHGRSVLSQADVREIRRLSAQGMTQRQLAVSFGIDKSTVGTVVRRSTWRGVD